MGLIGNLPYGPEFVCNIKQHPLPEAKRLDSDLDVTLMDMESAHW